MTNKLFTIFAATVFCASVAVADAAAQSRGGRSGGRGPSGRGPSVGRVSPRSPSVGRVAPRGVYGGAYRGSGRYVGPLFAPRFYFPRFAPFARYYYPSYYYRPGFSFGFYAGLGYPYYAGYYGYPYYGYPYYSGYPYAYSGYSYPYGGAVAAQPGAPYGEYGEVRIQDAPKDAEVYADGRLVGSVGDFDGPVRHLPLQAGPHAIEIRLMGMPPMTYDVDVRPGQTLTIHAGVR